ncbi:AMP-binding protein [Paenibacillus sp. NEAU-GSW1]|uniref:AMP-binding protein n=1 Tax=Paenibacillus sp. NEAU-GSW1 TaxID=2682486 RepID=UPI0012E26F93|nr:AMP-binding protein [Paenibacillus sp. NEAU-GSW1]MUT66988.1 AMP-binding protein [Paenibacillus sp. NEAU-GSW1]
MRFYYLVYVLHQLNWLSPLGLYRLLAAISRYGVNLLALLKIAERAYGGRIALTDDRESATYSQLLEQSEKLSFALKRQYGIMSGSKVAFLCKNHAALVKGIYAVSGTGADIYLLNAEMSDDQFRQLQEAYSFDLIIYDAERIATVERIARGTPKLAACHERLPAVNRLLETASNEVMPSRRPGRHSSGKLMLLTGGTTGKAKSVAHKPSLMNYLIPFSTMLTRLRLTEYKTAYIATPIYHGYGIALLLLFSALGKRMIISEGFHAEKACGIVREYKAEVISVVPLMIERMLKQNAEDLKSLACIASGGAELNPRLAAEVSAKLGDVLYNLYGTSEAGLNVIATPYHLKYSPSTIGKLIKGVRLYIVDRDYNRVADGTVGQFCIRNDWSMRNRRGSWIETGDLGYRDENGYYFLKGRVDDRIVSGGENVYPIELERILLEHPSVEDAAVIGIADEQFGQRLKAFVQTAPDAYLTEEQLTEWLRSKAARYQMPKGIVLIDQIPYTPLGKRDKKRLKEWQAGN